jgi:hypothetical protein
VVDYTPKPVPSSGYILKNPLALKKDHLISVLPFIGTQYKITFDVYISSYGKDPWYSLIHFTHNGNAETFGDRTPGIWITNEKKIHVAFAISGNKNYYIDSQTIYPLKTWIPLEVSQTLVDKKVNLSFKNRFYRHNFSSSMRSKSKEKLLSPWKTPNHKCSKQ